MEFVNLNLLNCISLLLSVSFCALSEEHGRFDSQPPSTKMSLRYSESSRVNDERTRESNGNRVQERSDRLLYGTLVISTKLKM